MYAKAKEILIEKAVEKLSIFTRSGNLVNYLYQKWGGQLICQDWLVVGVPKSQSSPRFNVDLLAGKLRLSDQTGNTISYYQREGVYILSDEEALSDFHIERVYQELTYVINL